MKKFLVFLCAMLLLLGAINVANATLIGSTIEGEGQNFLTLTTFFHSTEVVTDSGTPEFSGTTSFVGNYLFEIDFDADSVWVDVTSDSPYSAPPVDLIFTFTVFVSGDEFILVDVVERFDERSGVLGVAPADTIVTDDTFTILMPGFVLADVPGTGSFHFDVITESVAPVPEPSTMLLIGTGLIGLMGFRRKFRK